jgi:hypothetical protein
MRRNITRLITLAAVTLFAACSDSSGPNADVTGSYALITLNGSGLQIVVSFDQFSTFRITGGNVTLASNNTFTSSGTYQETFANGQTTTGTETCDGTYTRNGNSITFTEVTVANTNCGGVYNGTWDGDDTITVAFDATVQAVFRK